jgi:DNA-binding SARP family transcriptional activator
MMHRTRIGADLGRGLAALASLVGLVIGVPVGLLRLAGSPVPTSVPHWSEVARALSESRVADTTLIKGAALICWIAWAVLVLCVVVELAAWVAGRTAARLPIVGPFQLWAARLVASAVLVFSSVAGMVRPAVAVPTTTRATVTRVAVAPQTQLRAVDPPGRTSPEEAAVATRPALPEPADSKRYIVDPPGGRHRDTLWGIAERHLGNPERWPEIFQLNKGRYTGGHYVTNPHWIYAGEELIMPADAIGLDGAVAYPPTPPVRATPPSPQSSVEMRVLPDGQAQPQAARKTSDGWRIAHAVTDLLPTRLSTAGAIGGGILAAGVIATLDRQRRTRQRLRKPGAPFLVPDHDLAEVELGLRVAANPEGAELTQLALKLVHRTKCSAQVLGLRVGSRQVAIRFVDAPPSPPPPFRAVGDAWVLARRAITQDLIAEAAHLAAVASPLVTLGTTDDGETVLLNLQATSLTSVAGSRETAVGFLGGAALELANSGWIDSGRLVVAGLGEDLSNLRGVTAIPTIGDVYALEPGDVLVSADPPGALAEALPAGAAVLAVGPVRGARCRLVMGDERLEADVLDAVVRPQTVARRKVSDIAKLLEPVADPVEESPFEPVSSFERCDVRATMNGCSQTNGVKGSTTAAESVPPAELDVRVLGPIEIVGAEKTLTRAKSIELVAYLAVHRESVVDADRLREALWPGRPPGTTLYTTASVARNHLGRATDGEQHLPLLPNGERLYRLGNSVGTDYERFAEGVRRAKSEAPADAMRTLRAALELVRGRPFDVSSRGYEWAHVEGFITCIENEVAGAAHQLARLCLEVGDADGARWATRQGLRASPGNEQLFRDEMQAADLEGNPAGVEALLSELSHIVEEESPLESLHPETVALYNELTSGERAARLARTG